MENPLVGNYFLARFINEDNQDDIKWIGKVLYVMDGFIFLEHGRSKIRRIVPMEEIVSWEFFETKEQLDDRHNKISERWDQEDSE